MSQGPSKRLWWIPALGFGIALLLLGANGWVTMEMTSQFREYGKAYLQKQTAEHLKRLAQEESQLTELAVQSLMRGRSPEDLLTEEFSILFYYDLAAILESDHSLQEAYLFNENGRKAIKPGSPWHDTLSNNDFRQNRRPVTFRFVSSEDGLYLIYAIRDPRDFNDLNLILGKKMPSDFATFSGNSDTAFRVLPDSEESPELQIKEKWDLSHWSLLNGTGGIDRRRGPPRQEGRWRFGRGGGRKDNQGGGHPSPLTSEILNQEVILSKQSYQMDSETSRAMVYSHIEGSAFSEPVRIEFLVSREFPETLESTIKAIRRNSLGVGLLVCLFTVIVVTEMRRRKKAETTLLDRNEKLNEANQRKDRLLAIISHDLRAPLSGVSNLSGLLMKQPESFTADEIRKFAGEIQGTSKHLTELLDNLLNWARLQTGQLPYFPGSIDLERVAHQIRTLFASTAKERGVHLEIQVSHNAKLVNDVEMLRTILRNLFSNAIRHTPTGGSVLLHCEAFGNLMRIEVRDTGEGMTRKEQSELFQVPDKPRDPTEVGKKGAGFGLVLSQKLADRMGGRLSVETVKDKGTTFRLEVPLQWIPEAHSERQIIDPSDTSTTEH